MVVPGPVATERVDGADAGGGDGYSGGGDLRIQTIDRRFENTSILAGFGSRDPALAISRMMNISACFCSNWSSTCRLTGCCKAIPWI